MKNNQIADTISAFSSLLYLSGYDDDLSGILFSASGFLRTLSEDLTDMYQRNRLSTLSDIPEQAVESVKELLRTGSIAKLDELKAVIPVSAAELFLIPGIERSIIRDIYLKTDIRDVDSLFMALKHKELSSGSMLTLRQEAGLREVIEVFRIEQKQRTIDSAVATAAELIAYMKNSPDVINCVPAGDLVRGKDVFDTVILVVSSLSCNKVIDFFANASYIYEHHKSSSNECSAVAKSGMNVRLAVVPPERFSGAVFHFTGSEVFLDELYSKYHINCDEFGPEGNIESDKEIFKSHSIQYIDPVLREGRGEIELAARNAIPELIKREDIKGDFHVHSIYSDGKNSISLLAHRAIEMGYSYIGIADHSASLDVANGLKGVKLKEKIRKIRQLNKELNGFKILCATEADILPDGSVDYTDKERKSFDYVIGSVHVALNMSRCQMTERIIKAVESGKINILGHPTGRLFGVRRSLELDIDEIMEACAANNVAMEISGYVRRLDLNDSNIIKAKKKGVRFAIGTDAHYVDNMESVEYAVLQAQRAMLTRFDVINTMTLDDLYGFFKK